MNIRLFYLAIVSLFFGLVFAVSGGRIPVSSTVQNTLIKSLPAGKPTCCEHEWTIRFLTYHPAAVVPRRMYSAACGTGTKSPRMFTSFSLGKNAKHPKADPSSGAIVESRYNPRTGKLEQAGAVRHFPECVWMEGIAVSEDCKTVSALCRRRYGDRDYDFNSLKTHPNHKWMTQPKCARLSMWMYEWKNGDIRSRPKKIVVHKAVDFAWEYGNNYLRYGENDGTYGIGVKARVVDPRGQCHEADAFLVMNSKNHRMTRRGHYWACGTGHTTFNRPAYNPHTRKYAVMCSTDYSALGKSDKLTGFWLRMENTPSREFGYTNNKTIHTKGGTATLLPLSDGGYLGMVVGVPGRVRPRAKLPLRPPTSIGLARFDSKGKLRGGIRWIVSKRNTYLSYPQITPLGRNRYLLGYGIMKRLGDSTDRNDASYRIPWEYYTQEIDINGRALTVPRRLRGTGWGEQDEMVSLGRGRVGWAYIPNPTLGAGSRRPDCNSSSLQLSAYTSRNVSPNDYEDPTVDKYPYVFSDYQGVKNESKEVYACEGSRLTGLKWHYGTIIDRVRGICGDGSETKDLGARSGRGPKSFTCKGEGNFVAKLEAWTFGYAKAIDRIRITCKDGTSSGIVGGWGKDGKLAPAMSCPAGSYPVGISGNKNGWLKLIALTCKKFRTTGIETGR